MSEMGMRRTPERKVLGDLGNTKPEPVSPTANLRLLTSLASNLGNASDCVNQNKKVSKGNRTPSAGNNEGLKLLPRKQKSLGLLCDKFLSVFPLVEPEGSLPRVISLDCTAKALGTEKRRIYDIINVLESLEMATKAGKNRYLWHGQSSLVKTLIKFKSIAIKMGLRDQIQEIQRINKAYTGDHCEDSPSTSADNSMIFEDGEEDFSGDSSIKEDKSLGAMCQKFVMLFLISLKNGVINLEIAAKVLITDIDNRGTGSTDGTAGSRFKTKVRRLYDIANVLTAIGLIKKVYMYDRTIRKPVFKYIGPDVEYVDLDRETPVRQRYISPSDMMTPSKSCDVSGLRIPASSCTNTATRFKALSDESTGTPVTDKRKPRKRKLFVGESSFPRTHSSPCLDSTSRSLERLDDSILQVAEMELQKLNSSEESKPKACTKLFSRYNSDSCIAGTNVIATSNQNSSFVTIDSHDPSKQTVSSIGNVPFLIVSKENVVTRYVNESPKTSHQTSTPLRTPLKITTLNSIRTSTPVRSVARQIDPSSMTRLLPATSLAMPAFKTIVPRKLITTNGAAAPSSSSSCEPRKFARVTQYKIEPQTKPPKIINLTNFDPKKLIPIKRSDLRISLTPVNPIVLDNTGSPGFAILTRIPAPIVSPGDTFKAVKIGNTLQLVPMTKNDETSLQSNIECENIGNNGNES